LGQHVGRIGRVQPAESNTLVTISFAKVAACLAGYALHSCQRDQVGIKVQTELRRIGIVLDVNAVNALAVLKGVLQFGNTFIVSIRNAWE